MPGAAFRMHRLGIEGFKAFAAPQSLEIGGHVFVFGRNSLGKSSVVEAVRWCLFGALARGGFSQRLLLGRRMQGRAGGPRCMDHPEGCLIIVFFNTGDNLDAT